MRGSKRYWMISLLISLSCFVFSNGKSISAESAQKLRIIVFGAHPDDCELKVGGMAAIWASQGHHVKFVSATNGDIGHAKMAGGPLAKRRSQEVKNAAKILGTTSEVLDIHDGELMPTLENRKTFVRLIREWKADVVIGHRPNDYHPDHRYTGILMQDAAFIAGILVGYGPIATAEDGLAVFIQSIPYNFYGWLAVILAGMTAYQIIPNFGPMRKAEVRAQKYGKVLSTRLVIK
jgi:LmbE family N-acetylglucosaminyl deacetylase